MKISIRTGFGPISHGIPFNANVVLKGKALAVSHVIRVEELRHVNASVMIRGSVIPQTSVNATPYRVQLHLSDKRHITDKSCTCVSQAGGKCKHICALIHYVNSDRSITKTSLEQEWGKPSDKQLGQEKYAKPMRIENLFGHKKSETSPVVAGVSPIRLRLENLKHPSAIRRILKEYSMGEGERIVRGIVHDCIDFAITISDNDYCDACITSLINFCEDHAVYSLKLDKRITDQNEKALYAREILLNETEIMQICVQTQEQSHSEKWFSVQTLRISASSRAHSIKSRTSKTPDELANDFLTPSNLGGRAKKNTQYGLRNEHNALKEYQACHGTTMVQTGVIILKTQPWLCASPDGVVVEDGCITKIVEIKCPASCEKVPVVDSDLHTTNVHYLYFEAGGFELKKSHVYYTQCQIQLYVTGLTVCDLYVWSPKGSCSVEVHRDEHFLKALIPKLETFYFKHFLKALVCFSDEKNNNKENVTVNKDS